MPNPSPAEGTARKARRISAIDASRMPEQARGRGAFWWWRYAAVATTIVFLGVLGSWTHHAIEGSLRQLRADSLSAMLDAQAQAVEVWVDEKLLATRRLARDARLRSGIAARFRDRQQGCVSLAQAGLREPIEPFLQDETVA